MAPSPRKDGFPRATRSIPDNCGVQKQSPPAPLTEFPHKAFFDFGEQEDDEKTQKNV